MGDLGGTFRSMQVRGTRQAPRSASARFLMADSTALRSATTCPECANTIMTLTPFVVRSLAKALVHRACAAGSRPQARRQP
jgi:hypothetical protein